MVLGCSLAVRPCKLSCACISPRLVAVNLKQQCKLVVLALPDHSLDCSELFCRKPEVLTVVLPHPAPDSKVVRQECHGQGVLECVQGGRHIEPAAASATLRFQKLWDRPIPNGLPCTRQDLEKLGKLMHPRLRAQLNAEEIFVERISGRLLCGYVAMWLCGSVTM